MNHRLSYFFLILLFGMLVLQILGSGRAGATSATNNVPSIDYFLEFEFVAGGIHEPVGITNAGDGRMFVWQRDGIVRIIDENGTLRTAGQIDYEESTELTILVRTSDPHGAYLEENFVIEVIDLDEDVPVLTLLGEANMTHGVGLPFVDSGASWTDPQDGGGVVYANNELSTDQLGTFTLLYEFSDSAGNAAIPRERTVAVVDKTKPEISLIGDGMIIHEGGSAFVDPGANWTDNIDGNGTVYSTDIVNINRADIFTILYNYTDAGGNEATVSRTVVVQDTRLPVLTLLGEEEIRLPVWYGFIDPWVEAYDAVDGNISDQVELVGRVFDDFPGEYNLAYTLTDSSGNRAQAVTRTVIVENLAPVGIRLEDNQTEENQPVGTFVGQLRTIDPDDPEGVRFYSYKLLEDENTSSSLFSVDATGQVLIRVPLDYETQSSHIIRVRTRDQFGAEYVQEIGIEVLDTTVPIVHTRLPVLENGRLRIGGQIEHRGGLERATRTGVLLGGQPIYPGIMGTDRVQELNIQLTAGASVYSSLTGLDEITVRHSGTLYVVAYAENSEGRAYGLEERIDVTPRALEQDNWTGAKALENRKGWWNSPWFGTYYRSEESGWLLHLGLGWMYPAPGANNGLWLWKEGLNWLWTDEGVYPFLYSSDTGTWMYFYGELNRQRLLYDYGLQKWMTLDEAAVSEEEGAR